MSTKIKYIILTLCIVVPILSMFTPILFSNRIFFDEDIVSYNYPTFFLSSTASKAGQNINWNPYYLSGFPTTLSPVGDHIDPLNEKLISVFGNSFDALHFRIFISDIFLTETLFVFLLTLSIYLFTHKSTWLGSYD